MSHKKIKIGEIIVIVQLKRK